MKTVNQLFKDSTDDFDIESMYKIFVSKGKQGTVLCTLLPSDIVSNSAEIDTKAMSSNSFVIGGVNLGTLKFTLSRQGINKMKTAGVLQQKYCLHIVQWNKVNDVNQNPNDLSENLDHTENTTGKIDLGYFYISKIQDNAYTAQVIAYDALVALDELCSNELLAILKDGENRKTAAEIASDIEDYTTTDWYDFQILVDSTLNSTLAVYLDEGTNPKTYRDLLGYLTQLLGGYADATSGDIRIKAYSLSTVAETINKQRVFNTQFDGKPSGIDRVISSQAGFDFIDQSLPISDTQPLTLCIPEIPYLRAIQEAGEETINPDIETALQTLSTAFKGLVFTGGSVTINAKPYLEIGDKINVTYTTVNDSNVVGTATITNFIITQSLYKICNQLSFVCSSSVGGTNVTSSTKSDSSKSSGSGGKSSGGGGLTVLGKEVSSDTSLSSGSDKDVVSLAFYTGKGADVEFIGNMQLDSPSDGTIELKTEVNGVYLPLSNKIKTYSGIYSYPFNNFLPEDMKEDDASYSVKLKADGMGTIKPHSSFAVIANGLRKSNTEESDPSYFEFDNRWLDLAEGLYDKDMNLLATMAQLISDGFVYYNDSGATVTRNNWQVLDAYGTLGNILVMANHNSSSDRIKSVLFSEKIETYIFKNCKLGTPFAQWNFSGSPQPTNRTAVKRIFLGKDCTHYDTSAHTLQGLDNCMECTLFTDAEYGESTTTAPLFTANYWDVIQYSGVKRLAAIYKCNQDLNYTVQGGTPGSGLVFNEGDLNLQAGLYDSANRLICDWATLESLGLNRISRSNGEWGNDYIAPYNGKWGTNIGYLFTKGTKLIVPDTVTTIGAVMFAEILVPSNATEYLHLNGETRSNLKVIIFKHAVELGRYVFAQNTGLVDIYLPVGSTAYQSSNSPFAGVDADIRIYTDDVESHKQSFGTNTGIISASSSVPTTIDNIICLG